MSDKRSVSTDALETLGTIINADQGRDAIHLAVEPIQAAEDLYPGQHIGIVDGKATTSAVKKLGIVDPFINGPVLAGEWFWLIVYPRQITSLRHVWSHPDFADSVAPVVEGASSRAESEEWLRNFCDSADCPGYDAVITAITTGYESDGGYYGRSEIRDGHIHFGGYDAHGEIPKEFWDHAEIVTGIKFSKDDRAEYFSCSC